MKTKQSRSTAKKECTSTLQKPNCQIKFKNKQLKFIGGGKAKIKIATIDKKKNWTIAKNAILESRNGYFDAGPLNIFDVLTIKEGILLFYYTKRPFALGAALYDSNDPEKIIWRSAEPIWQGIGKITPTRITIAKRIATIYFQTPKGAQSIRFSLAYLFGSEKPLQNISKDIFVPTLSRTSKNPILEPNPECHWECCATFNTAAIYLDEKVHFIYRAIGLNGSSVLGYAASNDGLHISERLSDPVYVPSQPFECRRDDNPNTFILYSSGGGWGGCEDPRLVKIDDIIYMTYTAFNGHEPPGVALTSIKVTDFLNRNWNWKKPLLISPKGEIHKNWVLFPKKIMNKYAIIHSISPKIMIEYLDNLDFKDKKCIKSYHGPCKNNLECWDNQLRGIGPPPIETKYGWLVLYHAMDKRDPNRYKIGAMMLDKSDPTKILYRSTTPILAPDMRYENNGYKPNVIYTCGAIVNKNTLFVYYGGADTVICAATANFTEFLSQLRNSQLLTQGVITSVL